MCGSIACDDDACSLLFEVRRQLWVRTLRGRIYIHGIIGRVSFLLGGHGHAVQK
jgi:hypothetical protein